MILNGYKYFSKCKLQTGHKSYHQSSSVHPQISKLVVLISFVESKVNWENWGKKHGCFSRKMDVKNVGSIDEEESKILALGVLLHQTNFLV